MEILFMLLWRMREEKEFNKNRALIQANVLNLKEPKAAIDAFRDYQNSWMPFIKRTKELEDKKFKEIMLREIERGPVRVIPMRTERPKGIKQGLKKGEEAIRKRAQLLKEGKLKSLDPFRRRRRNG